MMRDSTANATKSFNNDDLTGNLSIQKITTLWAFSESAFGGLLHALKVPFRGIFINSAAVIFITLIAHISKHSKAILKSTMIVLLIKALVSPHTPLTAYLAVSLQGILGYILFLSKKFFKISALLLGIFTLIFSGAQKIILLTILFGNTLWKSINIFLRQITDLFFNMRESTDINFAYMLIGVYLLIHLIAGIFIGFYAGKLPEKIVNYSGINTDNDFYDPESDFFHENQRKKRNWYQRPTGVLILLLSFILLLLTYISPSEIGIKNTEIIFMLLRSVILTFIWIIIISPIFRKLFQKFLSSRKSGYTTEMNKIINEFPEFKKILSVCWSNSSDKSGFKRFYKFLSASFFYLLFSE